MNCNFISKTESTPENTTHFSPCYQGKKPPAFKKENEQRKRGSLEVVKYYEALRLYISDSFCCTYLISVHVIHVIQRLFVVMRFKATDVSLSVVGCAPHLK